VEHFPQHFEGRSKRGLFSLRLKPPNTIVLWWSKGFQGALNQAPHNEESLVSRTTLRLIAVVFPVFYLYDVSRPIVLLYLFLWWYYWKKWTQYIVTIYKIWFKFWRIWKNKSKLGILFSNFFFRMIWHQAQICLM